MGDAQAYQPIFFFGDFHLDPANARLQRGSQTILLKPRRSQYCIILFSIHSDWLPRRKCSLPYGQRFCVWV